MRVYGTDGINLGGQGHLAVYGTDGRLVDAAGGGLVTFSAGVSSAGLSSIVFSNDNNVSFGLNGSTITAIANTVGGGAITNINISAGTTSNNLSNLVFTNGNGVTFGLDGSTISASVNAAGGGLAAVYDGANSISSGTIRFTNANGVSFSINGQSISGSVQTNYAGTGFTSTTTAGTEIKATLGNNGLSMGVPAYLTAGGGAAVTISSYQNVIMNQTAIWSNSTSHAVAFQLPQNGSFSFLRIPALFTNASTGLTTQASSANMSAVRQYTFNAVVYSMGTGASSQSLMSVTSGSCAYAILHSASIATNGSVGSYTQALTWHQEGVSSTLSTQYSQTGGGAYPFSSGMFTGFTNNRLLDINFAASLTPGPYWLVVGMASTTSANSARISQATTAGGYYSNHFGASQLGSVFRRFGLSDSTPAYLGGGRFSTAGGGTVSAINMSNISSASNQQIFFQLLRSA